MIQRKTAYLTIDDAPSEDFLKKTDYLESMNISAVFFCTGENLESNFASAVKALKKGFILGNHSYSHPHFSRIDFSRACGEITRTGKLLEKAYSEAQKNIIRIFRFPYGDKGYGDDIMGTPCPPEKKEYTCRLQEFLKANGYRQPAFTGINYKKYYDLGLLDNADVFWTYDCKEWTTYLGNADIGDIIKRMDEDSPEDWKGLNRPGSSEIILLHDHIETTRIFEKIIGHLAGKSLDFKLPDFNNS